MADLTSKLFYGDNLEILRSREYFPDECIDLIYLDPPFNSNRNYNVLFKDETGKAPDAQVMGFEDTWQWINAQDTYYELLEAQFVPSNVRDMIVSMVKIAGETPLMAYLVMMTARLIEMHRVLKSTGTLYLHCDPSASHYLKLALDAIFDIKNFRNEIIWQRTTAKGLAFTRFATNHDVILRYSKGEKWTWNAQYAPHNPEYIRKSYRHVDDATGRRYRLDNLVNPAKKRPNLTYEFLGVTRVWRWTKERMQQAYDDGLIVQTKEGGVPAFKRYLDEQEGTPIGDVWTDIAPLQGSAKESLGYPTQKPLALLERIIKASSNEGDIVLDPFCGCGTAVAAAQMLGRKWLGIDITHLAITLQKKRMYDMFPEIAVTVVGEPQDIASARQLAQDDRYQFQWWALSLIKAKPVGSPTGSKQGKKGADKGIDGVIDFVEAKGKPERVIIQVKSGKVKSGDIRDLKGALEREQAALAVFITLDPATREMLLEATTAGMYDSQLWAKKYPRIQIVTIEELFEGKTVNMPPPYSMFKQAERVRGNLPATKDMFEY